ncbi:SH3 domain-containing protein [Spirochaeta thermophila]|uniref:SH3b domain-containing protein n=1 Tax=Winmispira thermophila (strain ATCC 49972 / DSM 6192 / RI 19.B1) TaxID=665571 RepID=E0RQJ4_WINT6|nr:SH3 domain-containing protein [Spirochaeta thermophila]ADN01498.1 hypothetical protein STHERM_c05290 [Spirochaeta thermophila DSM 6192]
MRGRVFLLACAALILFSGCREDRALPLEVPASPPLSEELRWAVVQDAYARLWDAPPPGGSVVGILRRGDMLEIVEEEGAWCRVVRGTEEGWVGEGHLLRYRIRLQAETASRRLIERF